MSIRTLGDPVLRRETKAVERFDDALRRLADDMFETMYAAPGVGLAANQVGLSLACFVYDDQDDHRGFVANPRLSAMKGSEERDEGCLSIPGPFHPTQRASALRLRGQGLDGSPMDVRAEGLLARIFQHEADHLRGMLYIDRLDDAGRRDVMRQLRELELKRAQEA
ncbi:MAG TPA: peptide deformylase [Actinomycetota bacterium]|jgi:peptide deformylase|nr:peptide deformylase [Actinomycetota bacterium]